MQSSNIPKKFPAIWANGASATYVNATIPTAQQSGNQASFFDGFPPPTFAPPNAGGEGPDGKDMNGILQMTTAAVQYIQAGGIFLPFDSTFSGYISGYPKFAVLRSNTIFGVFWLNTVEGNTTDPDSTSAAGWQNLFSGLATVAQLNAEAATRAYQISLLFATPRAYSVTDGSRSLGVQYTNSYGRPFFLNVIGISQAQFANLVCYVAGNLVAEFGYAIAGAEGFVSAMVPAGATYQVTNNVAGVTLQTWVETY